MPDKSKDWQSRITIPPAPIPRGEDDPPMARSHLRRDVPPSETIARIALRAPKAPPTPSEHEEVMRALAQLTSEKEAFAEERRGFEERMQEELRRVVIEELPRHQPATIAPRSRSEHAASSWFAHIPATLMGLAALVGVVAQSCKGKSEVSADVLAKITAVSDRLTAHITVTDLQTVDLKSDKAKLHSYQLEQRCWLSPVLEKLSVKVDSPEGTPSCPTMEFYARPLLGSKAPTIQPHAPFPSPPP